MDKTQAEEKSQQRKQADDSKQTIELKGKVVEALPSAVFRVEIESNKSAVERVSAEKQEVLAHLSGKMRVNHIRILPGDQVLLEVTPYDLKRGRITRRL